MFESAIDIKQLKVKCFDNEELVLSLIERFEHSLEEYEHAFSESSENQDFEEMRALAHRLAGESGTMCAWKIHNTAKELCEASRLATQELIEIKISQLSIDSKRVREQSRRLKQTNYQLS